MTEHRSERPLRGVVLFCVAVVLFACLDATAKHLSLRWPVGMLARGRYTAHFALMTVLLAPHWRGRLLATRSPGMQTVRGLSLVAVTILAMAAFKRMPLAEATALLFASPLIVALLARPVLGEQLGPTRWIAVLLGFIGVVMLTRPGSGLDPVGVVCALSAAIANAVYQLLTRKMSRREHPVTLLYYTALTGAAALTIAQPVIGPLQWPGWFDASLIVTLGLLGGIGHYLLTRAFRDAPASVLAPLSYTQLIWATLLGWMVFDNTPSAKTLSGIAVIGASGLLIAWDSTRNTES